MRAFVHAYINSLFYYYNILNINLLPSFSLQTVSNLNRLGILWVLSCMIFVVIFIMCFPCIEYFMLSISTFVLTNVYYLAGISMERAMTMKLKGYTTGGTSSLQTISRARERTFNER